jgi:AcrR family transcriptional regulator
MPASKKPPSARRTPKQERSRATVDAVLEAAARVFRREGWDATTNRIAEAAGVGIGSLYEYFPNKNAIVVALAERHMETAESAVESALGSASSTRDLVAALQQAILESHRFPSQALEIVRDVPQLGTALLERATNLEARVLAALEARAAEGGHRDARLRAIAAFEAIGTLTAHAVYQRPNDLDDLARHYRAMALERLTAAT